MHRQKSVVSVMVLFFLAASAFGADVKGTIIMRTGDTITVKTADANVTVVLTDNTSTKDDRGLFGLDKQHMSNVVLIPGLKVDIDGEADEQGRVVAKTITVDGDDLETAEMIQSGLHPTAQQVAENVRRLEEHSGRLAAHGEDIATNQQDIATHQQKIQQNMTDIEEHTNRFAALTDFDVKGEAKVNFDVGSTKISSQDKEELKKLAEAANGFKGYII